MASSQCLADVSAKLRACQQQQGLILRVGLAQALMRETCQRALHCLHAHWHAKANWAAAQSHRDLLSYSSTGLKWWAYSICCHPEWEWYCLGGL